MNATTAVDNHSYYTAEHPRTDLTALTSSDAWATYSPPPRALSIAEEKAEIAAAQDKLEAMDALIAVLGGVIAFGIGVSIFVLSQLP